MATTDLDGVQRAAAFVAARSRDDHEAAAALLADYPSDADRSLGFMMLSELAIRLLAAQDAQPVEVIAQQLALMVAHTGTQHGPWDEAEAG